TAVGTRDRAAARSTAVAESASPRDRRYAVRGRRFSSPRPCVLCDPLEAVDREIRAVAGSASRLACQVHVAERRAFPLQLALFRVPAVFDLLVVPVVRVLPQRAPELVDDPRVRVTLQLVAAEDDVALP